MIRFREDYPIFVKSLFSRSPAKLDSTATQTNCRSLDDEFHLRAVRQRRNLSMKVAEESDVFVDVDNVRRIWRPSLFEDDGHAESDAFARSRNQTSFSRSSCIRLCKPLILLVRVLR